jgi:hypothetical protein
MPVPAQVRLVIGNDHEMKDAWRNGVLTAWAEVVLACGVWLNGGDRHPEKIAHATTAKIATRAMTIAAMSAAFLFCSRNGLKPTLER